MPLHLFDFTLKMTDIACFKLKDRDLVKRFFEPIVMS